MSKRPLSIDKFTDLIVSGDRVGLSQAITLVESTLPEDRLEAEALLTKIYPSTGNSIRIGITGVPGVGKSTFIESFGTILTQAGHKVAILAIDPSSRQSKGSILGDKTRMDNLAVDENAFIRPSPNAGKLGGVTNSTRESILLCEAAGYDIIIVETVGVGQSEVAVKNMTDFFLLLMLAGAGDELQGIKRGIMEMADLIAINKADGDNLKPAKLSRTSYENALHLMAPNESGWQPQVVICSALKNEGLTDIWSKIEQHKSHFTGSGTWQAARNEQQLLWFEELLNQQILEYFKQKMNLNDQLDAIKDEIINHKIAPSMAAREIISKLF